MNFEDTFGFAKAEDEKDILKNFRNKFFIPQHDGRDAVYFTGNSLGLEPKSAKEYIQQELDDWARLGVEGHTRAKNPWVSYHESFARPLAHIVGARPEEVVAMNQLTVNLHLLMATFYRPTKTRFKIICEGKAFPSDLYAIESQVRWHGLDPKNTIVEVHPRENEHNIRTEDLVSIIEENGNQTALVLIGGVNYYTGQVFDMQAITDAAHGIGAIAGFDLAHGAGNIPLSLHDWDIDFAAWCSYKYLNSGPGGVSGIFIHEKWAKDTELLRLAGWWGHDKESRFKMEKEFKPIPTAEGWQMSNAPVLSLAVHKASLDIFEEAGTNRILTKSKRLTAYLWYTIEQLNKSFAQPPVEIITPHDERERGCQVSMLLKTGGKSIFDKMIKAGIIADWREPDVIRIAPVPLYNSFEDVWAFGNILQKLIREN